LISPLSAESLPGKGISVYPLQSTIEEEAFQTLLVSRALSVLGYEVYPIKKLDYDSAYARIASNDATFMAVNWAPLHRDKYLAAGGDQRFYRQGHLIIGAAQGYLIDKKTAAKHGITNLSQLKDADIARLFDIDGDGVADLVGCDLGWACQSVIEHQLTVFGLDQRVVQQQSGYAVLMEQTVRRFKAGKPVLYYSWTPYWVNAVLKPGTDVVWLQVPFSALPGKRSGTDTTLPTGDNYGFEINSQRIVANRKFAEQNPVAAKLFEVMKLSPQDVSAQNLQMHQGERSAEDIERHVTEWIDHNQALFNGWLSIALAATHQ
jgi:glycine betaine/proline transport system substrate-binding protein